MNECEVGEGTRGKVERHSKNIEQVVLRKEEAERYEVGPQVGGMLRGKR